MEKRDDQPVRVVHGVGATLATHRAPYLTRLLVQQGFAVRPLVARNDYVSELTFRALAQAPAEEGPHLAEADVMVIAPLDAGLLGRIALGLATDPISEAVLAHRGPLVLAPSLPGPLADAPLLKEHLNRLEALDEVTIVPALDEGLDRMATSEAILSAVLQSLQSLQRADMS